MKKLPVALACTAIIALLSGCGSSSSDSTSTTVTGTGYYVDSAVQGAEYKCGSQNGVTDENGKFTFEYGQDCVFTLNGVTLRKVEKDDLVADEIKIIEDNTTVAAFLQTLDKDGDPSNGIQIIDEIKTAIKDKITEIPEIDELGTIVNTYLNNINEYNGHAMTLEEVESHLEETTKSEFKYMLAGKSFYATSVYEEGGNYTTEILTLTINSDADSITISDKDGNKIDTSNLTIIDGDKLSFTKGSENIEIKFLDFKKDFLLFLDPSDGTIVRLYFNQDKAQAYYNSLQSVDLKGLLANKTFYYVEKRPDGKEYGKITFNADATSDNWEAYSNTDSGTNETVTIDGAKIIFGSGDPIAYYIDKTDDYIILKSFQDGALYWLFYYKDEAEAYYNNL